MPIIIVGIIVLALLVALVVWLWPVFVTLFAAFLLTVISLFIRKKRYFSSTDFLKVKEDIADVVEEHNQISEYVKEIRKGKNFGIGKSSTGSNAHLAESINTSQWGYQRDRYVADYGSELVHNAGLQVVRNSAADPIKYLMKYFDIHATEEKLEEIEELGDSISRLENAIQNLKNREKSISEKAAPPSFILRFFLKEFQEKIGLSIPTLEVPYPIYKFQYVSAGGNSSQETRIRLDLTTIDSLIETISKKIEFKKTAAGQRSLMTAVFRNYIKTRDEFACRYCSVSISDEPNLLLEVDHIKPVSKGGLSVEANLQTLCWRCNRTKSNKETPKSSS